MKPLEEKVAVVTGAGGGLGRSHALLLASLGAKVVVNDPGVSRDGSGGTAKMADAVVEEIKKAGGQAVANHDSVATTEGAERLAKAAVDAFGRVDILVNNAGILRDKTIHNMTDEMWDLVLAVHLRGTFACTRAAARVMKEKGTGGRIINTTSVAGLKGNFGQSNYSAAKAGIYGFTLTAAMELAKDGITVNAIAPLAKTRMTEDVESVGAELKPEDVSPVVAFLASDLAKDVTGRVFGVHGKHLFEYRMDMTEGREKKEPWTIEEISAFVHAPAEAAGPRPQAPAAAGGNRIDALFKALPSSFVPEKSAGWESVIHFSIPGAPDWTVEVKGQKVRVTPEKPAAPTCVITVDADTMIGMIEGRVKGEMAFMSGKLKATKVPDLAKFGKAFDFKKLKEALEAPGAKPPATAAAAAPAGPVDLAALLGRLPAQFKADQALGFNGTLLFKVDGQAATVEIKDKACAVKPPVPSPTCTLTTDQATLGAILEGALDPQKAMTEGKIKATHLPSWLKFRQVFAFAPEKGLHRSLIGRRYNGQAILVRPERRAAYDEAVGDAGSLVFPVSLIKELFTQLFNDPDFNGDLTRMVHGEQLMVYHRPLRALDLVSPRGRVLGIEDKSSGQILNFGQKLYVEGELAVEIESRLFFRGETKGEKSAAPPPAPARSGEARTTKVLVAADLPKRYSGPSGDNNPIHLDEALAKSVGFKGVILQGLCTLALAARSLPKNLERLEVRFAKPVYPGDTLETTVWTKGTSLEFETVTQAGDVVLTNGRATARGV
jgi:NAD(P)-dependent dehydrogenase (short-subunit alcohol dehydrogenase family)/acyl dehydratase/putative sterol carrier protein